MPCFATARDLTLLQRLLDGVFGLNHFLDRAVFVEEEFVDADGAAEALSGLAVAVKLAVVVEEVGVALEIDHNGKLDRDGQTGQSLRRSVCVDELFFNEDGTIKAVVQTKDAIKEPLK